MVLDEHDLPAPRTRGEFSLEETLTLRRSICSSADGHRVS